MTDQEKIEKLRGFLEGFAQTAESAVWNHRKPKGGQQVSFHGDFAHVGPKTIGELEWWGKAIREVLEETR